MPRPHEENEQIQILFNALRDASNKLLFPQIKRILKDNGYSDIEIIHYQKVGKHLHDSEFGEFDMDHEMLKLQSELDGFTKEFSDVDDFFTEKIRGHRRSPVRFLAMAFIVTMLLVFAVVFGSFIIGGEEDKSTPPAITETTKSTVSDGDKL